MKILITGGCGFLGSNLALYGMNSGYEITIVDNFYRLGSKKNFDWLKSKGKFNLYETDISNYEEIKKVFHTVMPDFVFHLAGQTAMTTSLNSPLKDFEINTIGSINILESIKSIDNDCKAIYASSNKVYGDLEYVKTDESNTRYVTPEFKNGFPESMKIDFSTPYGCSKGAADLYFLDYCKSYKMKLSVFRHSTMYGGRQFATVDQGWIGWFCQKAIEIKRGTLREPFSISGNGKQVRDVLHSDDIVKLYFTASENMEEIKGEVFNIGGGRKNSLSLLELFEILESELGIKMEYRQFAWRNSDQKVFIADNTKIISNLKWTPLVDTRTGIIDMLKWLES